MTWRFTILARILFGLSLAATLLPTSAFAQSAGVSVSITPPLFDLTIGPGDSWSSAIKVVNTSSSPTTYYSYVADFKATGETGNASFVPLLSEKNDPTLHTYSLASWITLPTEPITVPASGSGQIPFTIHVPTEAEPGGHYAAVLIGTQPSTGSTTAGTQVNIASYVSSLLFVKIKGDVTEKGRIREFSTAQSLYQSAKADFTLRFENTGNTHVQPQGNIVIYNMWGRERGSVAINQEEGNFGNVLPGGVRRFQFSWAGNYSFDIGRYSAVVTLTYGQDGKKNVSATTYFWVIPVVPVASAAVGILASILVVTWLIRRYIRRALALEQRRLGISDIDAASTNSYVEPDYSFGVLTEPLREGVIDLRNLAGGGMSFTANSAETSSPVITSEPMTIRHFLRKYRLFLLFILVMISIGFFGYRYLRSSFTTEQHFKITDVKIGQEGVSK